MLSFLGKGLQGVHYPWGSIEDDIFPRSRDKYRKPNGL